MSRANTHPVFVVTSGRAGSTLLTAVFNAGNDLFFPPESDFITRAYPFFHDASGFGPEEYRVLARLFRLTSQGKGWGMKEDELTEELTHAAPRTFAEVNEVLYDAYLKRRHLEGSAWGIKRPVLIAHIDRILDVFPDARIVHLVRDGRDVYLSYMKVHESGQEWGPTGVVSSALYWVDGLRRLERISGGAIEELRYEDLLRDTEGELRRLCAFVGVEFDPGMLTHQASAGSNKDNVLEGHKRTVHRKVGQGIDSSNVRKYRTEMHPAKIFVFELIAGPYLKKYGYACEFRALSGWPLYPLQTLLYYGARLFNNWRYDRRDKEKYHQAIHAAWLMTVLEPLLSIIA